MFLLPIFIIIHFIFIIIMFFFGFLPFFSYEKKDHNNTTECSIKCMNEYSQLRCTWNLEMKYKNEENEVEEESRVSK